MEAIAVVLAYVVLTAPLLAVLLFVHRMQSDYTRIFLAALVLQIIPIGLVFVPLGLAGLALLTFTMVATLRRNHRFRTLTLDNAEVHRRWTHEGLANLLAFGLAVEQKGVAWLFMDVTAHRGFGLVWFLLVASAILWLALAPWLRREWLALRAEAA